MHDRDQEQYKVDCIANLASGATYETGVERVVAELPKTRMGCV